LDFFAHQAAARRQTRWLLLAFVVAVAAVVLALDVVVFWLLGGRDEYGRLLSPLDFARSYPDFAAACTLVILAAIGLASLYRSLQLRGGGGVVARSLGGVRVDRSTQDPKHRRLHNVVEEMAIASGVPMPEVYVLEHEAAVNALAAGHTPANAAIAVTQGALDRLNRDELQGVVAHEFSHVLNGDMRLNVQLLGWLAGLFVAAVAGRTLLRLGARGRKHGVPLLLAAVAFIGIGYIGLIAGRILQAAVSRQRERLADASAVQFTRYPDGLKGALLKIGGLGAGSRLGAAATDEVAHMLFAAGVRRLLLATHPPLAERIRALDPRFDPRQLERLAAAAPARVIDAAPQAISAQVGHPETVHVRYAESLRLALPPYVHDFAESSGAARALGLALLLSREPGVRSAQLELIAATLGGEERERVQAAAAKAEELAPMLRLPAVLQIFPALRHLSRQERETLQALVRGMAVADGRIDVFELCLTVLVSSSLCDELEARPPHGTRSLADEADALQVLFSTLARFGAPDALSARQAYEAGLGTVLQRHRPEYAAWPDWPRRLDAALQRVRRLQPFAKQALVEGLARTVAHDGAMSLAEAELLRTVCALLQCPLPPLLPQLAQGGVRAGG